MDSANLDVLEVEFNSVKFKETGFTALISGDGLVTTSPPIWRSPSRLYRIFDTEITGISFEDWGEIRDESIGPD
jgi:acetamidase/formamidase